jgi:regulator of replication initiation timing
MGILDNAKQVAQAVEEIHNLELYQRVLNLHSDIIELVEENNRLRNENQDLKKKLQLQEKMHFKAPFYYQDGDDTPFCPSCFESNKHEAVHVVKRSVGWICPTCKHHYIPASTS